MDYIIGDTQSKAGVRNPLIVIAHHICDLKPEHVIHLGDHWDLPSLGVYDKGKKKHTISADYSLDMRAGNQAMAEFWAIIKKRWPNYKEECVFIILRGNHEDRRTRALEYCAPEFHSTIEAVNFNGGEWNLTVPFLEIAKINGVEYSHFFANEGNGKAIGSARLLLNKRHVSCIAGHKQGFDYAEQLSGGENIIQAMIVGSSYYHDESYKAHTNHHFRGIVVLKHGGKAGFDYMRVSLSHLDDMYSLN